jgi:hypothetical protein
MGEAMRPASPGGSREDRQATNSIRLPRPSVNGQDQTTVTTRQYVRPCRPSCTTMPDHRQRVRHHPPVYCTDGPCQGPSYIDADTGHVLFRDHECTDTLGETECRCGHPVAHFEPYEQRRASTRVNGVPARHRKRPVR